MRKLNLKIISMTLVIFLAGFFILPSMILADQDDDEVEEEEFEEAEEEEEFEDAEDIDDDLSIFLVSQDSSSESENGGIIYDAGGMVKYVYGEVLDREPSQAEINSWVSNFNNGNTSAYTLVNMAMFGIEIGSQIDTLSNKDYIYLLYKLLFQRTPDLEGLNAWYNRLQSGKSKNDVLQGFIVSQEFANLCSKFNVKPYLSKEINNKIISALYAIGSLPATFTYVEMVQQEPASSSNSGSSQVTNKVSSSPPPSKTPPGMSGDCSACH